MNWVLHRAGGTEFFLVSGVSLNLSSYDNSLVEMSLAALAIFRGHYRESPSADRMSLVQMRLHDLPFEVER